MRQKRSAETAKKQIGQTARSMLAGHLSYLEGARTIADLSWTANTRVDADVLPFISLESETDDLPLGEVQALWSSEALQRVRSRIDEYEPWARQTLVKHWKALAERF